MINRDKLTAKFEEYGLEYPRSNDYMEVAVGKILKLIEHLEIKGGFMFKVGDRVEYTKPRKTMYKGDCGIIKDIHGGNASVVFDTHGIIYHIPFDCLEKIADAPSINPRDTLEELHTPEGMVSVKDLYHALKKKCECGADSCGGMHSDYCPKWSK